MNAKWIHWFVCWFLQHPAFHLTASVSILIDSFVDFYITLHFIWPRACQYSHMSVKQAAPLLSAVYLHALSVCHSLVALTHQQSWLQIFYLPSPPTPIPSQQTHTEFKLDSDPLQEEQNMFETEGVWQKALPLHCQGMNRNPLSLCWSTVIFLKTVHLLFSICFWNVRVFSLLKSSELWLWHFLMKRGFADHGCVFCESCVWS